MKIRAIAVTSLAFVVAALIGACGGDSSGGTPVTGAPGANGANPASDAGVDGRLSTDASSQDSAGRDSAGPRPDAVGPPDDAGALSCYDIHPYTRGSLGNFPNRVPSAAAEPAVGACVTDPGFRTTVCKVADATSFSSSEAQGVLRPVYSRWRHFNSSGEYYFLEKQGDTPTGSGHGQTVFYRSSNDAFAKASDINGHESAELRWDGSGAKPTTLYYVQECMFREYDMMSGQTQLVHDFAQDFPGCARIINDVEGDSSGDSRYWTWMVQGQYNRSQFPMMAIITYDKTTNTILGKLDLAGYHAMGGKASSLPPPNMVDMSPLGTKMIALFGRTNDNDAFDGPHAFDLDFRSPVKVCNDETHSGWAFDDAGNEVFVCQVNNTNWPNAPADTIAYTDIKTGNTEVIAFHEDFGWTGFHFGRFDNPAIRGWVYMTTYEGDPSIVHDQAVMLQLKPYDQHPLIWRIASLRNNFPGGYGYDREAYSPMSPDGRTLLWGADWIGGDGTVDTYRVTLPANWWSVLKGPTTVCN